MSAAINAATVTPTEVTSARAAGQSSGNASQEPRGREFSDVLRDTSANSRTDKANSTSQEESAGTAPSADTAAQTPTETGQSGTNASASGDVAAATGLLADAAAADAAVQAGNELPPWLSVIVEPLPANTPQTTGAVATVSASVQISGVLNDLIPAAAAVAHGATGTPPATPIANTADAAQSGVIVGGQTAPSAPAVNEARSNVTIEQLKLSSPASGASGFSPELATLVAGESVNTNTGERAAAAMTRIDTALTLAPSASGSVSSTQTTPAPTAATTTTNIPLPLNHPQWQEAFASRVAWQVKDGLQQVNVAINPPELGPIEVRMSLQDDKVSAQFVTAHHAVRQVIEDAMPKLREMLSQSGLSLSDASVFQQAPGRDGQAQQFAGGTANAEGHDPAGAEEDVTSHTTHTQRAGLVDAYV
jgi:flagellar hook-length control protein FliK